MRQLKVLFAGMQWDYGVEARGPSHEYTNLYDSLRWMPEVDAALFDFKAAHQGGGVRAVREGLIEAIDGFRPDVLFSVLFEDEVPRELLADLRDRPDIFTFNWFCDDHWRFESFTRRYAPLFNGCSTTATSALPKYERLGVRHVVKTQWACNPALYAPTSSAIRHEVTFVGQPHGNRREMIDRLTREGLEVAAWGNGWPAGRLTHAEMVDVFSSSRINLNLSNSSVHGGRVRRLLAKMGFGGELSQQIKGRNFEIPGTGGFQLSGAADDLERYFEPDTEIAIFRSEDELVEQCRRWLKDEKRRASVAEAGYRRTLAEHTYAHRFREIFQALDLA